MILTVNGLSNNAWISESKTIIGYIYDWCKNNISFLEKNYVRVFTHDVELSKFSSVFSLTQCSGKSFIEHGDIFQKSKLVSMILSNKTMCPEHKYRQDIIKKFSHKCDDHFGWGYSRLQNKIDGLRDYCFSFAMENATYPNMFTEKITDCFMTGTIPIYYGIPNIGDFFNLDGIISLTDNFRIEDLSFDLYISKVNAVKDNFEISKNLLSAEDFIYVNYIQNDIQNNTQPR